MRVIGKGSELKAAAYAGTYVVVPGVGHLGRQDAVADGFVGLCDRARRIRRGGQRGGTLLDARIKRFKERDNLDRRK
jgi:hypothetical protein